jgi:hypothetical protein
MNIVFVYYTLYTSAMSDTPQYYFLPIEIIHLLIDMIPLHRRDVCKQVGFFTNHATIDARLEMGGSPGGSYNQMMDAIERNNSDYCQKYYSEESISYREQSTRWDAKSFIAECGVYIAYWHRAVMYGRTEIIKLFYEIDRRASSPRHIPSLDNLHHKPLIKLIPNSSTLRWFLEVNCSNILSSSWIRHITREVIKREDLDCLIWLHSHVPIMAGHDIVPYTYLEYTIINHATIAVTNDLLIRIKDKRPKVLNWCRQQSWRMVIDWDHCIVS